MDFRSQAALWSEPELAGYLDKCQEPSKCWKKRLFLLQGHCLFYFRDEQQVKTMAPSGLIPVEGSSVASLDDPSARGFAFHISVGPKSAGASKRDTYVLAADSPEALEAWLRMLKIASCPRDVLFAKLRRTRLRADELRRVLSGSSADKQLLASSRGRELWKRRTRALKDKAEIAEALETAVLKADKQEAAVAQATLLWSIILNVVNGTRPSVSATLEHEVQLIKKLYKLLEVKGNLYQGQGIEDLNNASRLQLRASLGSAIDVIQERHAMIRARASRFSFLVDPNIYDQERLLEQASTTFDGRETEGRQGEELKWPPRNEKSFKMRRPPKLDGSKRKLKLSKSRLPECSEYEQVL